MPQYVVGGQKVTRKHLWMPCVINAEFDSMSPEEQARTLKATYWSDLITNAEWPLVVGEKGVKSYVRSRLKRKMVGWWMAIGRIAALNPELYSESVKAAKALYLEQIGAPHPCFHHHDDDR